jgi:hypothetical protein
LLSSHQHQQDHNFFPNLLTAQVFYIYDVSSPGSQTLTSFTFRDFIPVQVSISASGESNLVISRLLERHFITTIIIIIITSNILDEFSKSIFENKVLRRTHGSRPEEVTGDCRIFYRPVLKE